MKKLFLMILCFTLLLSNVAYAEDNKELEDKMKEIWLSPTENADVLENIYKVNQEKIEEAIALYLITPGYAREKVGFSADDEKMKQQVKEFYSVKENEILKAYYMKNNTYAKQYADNSSLRYLISDDNYWFMKLSMTLGNQYQQYETNGTWYDLNRKHYTTFGEYCITDEGFDFLKNNEKIYEALQEIDISTIQDVKFIALGFECTCLYIDCGVDEYLIRVYTGYFRDAEDSHLLRDWAKELEQYKLYNAKDFLAVISTTMNEMNKTKTIYEAEATALNQEGLLLGNENGLDLLKPLTRIEAATMLLRAMGEGTDVKTQTQTFADVPATHWGYGAAENAYSLGLIKGVGDDLFAPDDMVTATQFAAMVLRAGNHSEFNWENALDIMIDEGIISSENAAGMDFFTRGDMAKIVYEAKQRGIF